MGIKFWIILAVMVLAVLIFLIGLVLLVVPTIIEKSLNKVEFHPPYSISNKAKQLHQTLQIMDWHCDSLLWNRSLLKRANYGHVDVPRLIEGNVLIQMFTAVTKSPSGQNYQENKADSDTITSLAVVQAWPIPAWSSLFQRAKHQADRLHKFAAHSQGKLRIVKNQTDLQTAIEDHQRAIQSGTGKFTVGMLGIEGCHALDGDLDNIDRLVQAGYRMISLHHFFDNKLGGSLHGTDKGGLTEFGKQVVKRLEELEIIIDVAHSSPEVVSDVLDRVTRPLVVSHTGLYGVCASPRNIPDKLLKRIADQGGLVAIGYWDGAVCDITPGGVVRTMRYAIDLLGEDHVALGSDYDGSTTVLFDTSELAILTDTMLEQGFTEQEIKKIMGGNSMQFLQQYLPQD
jgi:membrane dipeptidase